METTRQARRRRHAGVDELQSENGELRRRLEEAEETIRAIQTGAVDAFVVEGPEGSRVYTLQGAERPYRLLIEQMQQGAATVHRAGTILYCNRQLAELLNVPHEKLIGAAFFDLFDQEHRLLMRDLLLQGGGQAETWLRRSDGRSLPVSLSCTPLSLDDAAAIGVIVTDLTTQRHYEQLADALADLQSSEERFRRLVALLPAGVYTCEASTGAITFYNEHAAALWGRAPALGETSERYNGSFRLWRPDGSRLPHEETPMALALREGRSFRNVELTVERPDGSRIEVVANIDPIRDRHGQVVGAINAFHDVSLLKQAQAALRAADRRKDEFLATLAHELRNPLAPIANSLALMEGPGADAAVAAEARATMQRQLAHMVRLIDDLLDLNRITRDKLELRRERIELANVVQSAVELTRPLAAALKHDVRITLPVESLAVDADPARLTQVFGNLLNNACKYTGPGGQISLRAHRDDGDIVVVVRDNGIGIAPEMLTHVFEMFTQVDHSLGRSQGGLGIGLTLVKRLVEMHGGSVSAQSEGLGRGSEFVVRLPAIRTKTDAPAPNRPAGFDLLPPHRILVVDDNQDAARSLSMLLKCAGHQVQTVYDGLAAVEAAQSFQPDVVLLDIGLPKLNGYEACRRIRQLQPGGNVVVIALTGWGQDEDRQKSSDAGFDGHLVKPVEFGALVKLIARHESAGNEAML